MVQVQRIVPKSKEYWLRRAGDARAMAEQCRDSVARASLLNVATSCEQLANYKPSENELLNALYSPATYSLTPKASHSTESHADPDLREKLFSYSNHVDLLASAEAVLDGLHEITSPALNLNMLWGMRFPRNVSDWDSIRVGRNVFLHKSAPNGWFEEWLTRSRHENPSIYFMARLSLPPITLTEMTRILAPIGTERWDIELALKHGIRDAFVCPVGGRWHIAFWSSRPITITKASRIMLFAAASFAAMRLDQLIEPYAESEGTYTKLTARERAVLRLLSWGKKGPEIAKDLGVSCETVKDFMESAKQKLGVNTQASAVAKAMRQQLIV